MISSADRRTKREFSDPTRKNFDEDGPSRPDVERPSAPDKLMERMKKVDPDKAKRYRQRSGQ